MDLKGGRLINALSTGLPHSTLKAQLAKHQCSSWKETRFRLHLRLAASLKLKGLLCRAILYRILTKIKMFQSSGLAASKYLTSKRTKVEIRLSRLIANRGLKVVASRLFRSKILRLNRIWAKLIGQPPLHSSNWLGRNHLEACPQWSNNHHNHHHLPQLPSTLTRKRAK